MNEKDYMNAMFVILDRKLKLFSNTRDFDKETIIEIVKVLGEKQVNPKDLMIALNEMMTKERFFSIATIFDYLPNNDIEVNFLHEMRANMYNPSNLPKDSSEYKAMKEVQRVYRDQFGRSVTDSYSQKQLLVKIENYYNKVLKNLKVDPNCLEIGYQETKGINMKDVIRRIE